MELTVNQRARDPRDRRDQARFRDGEAEQAIRSYAAREHVTFGPEQRQVEDRALEAAQADRAAGLHTMVIVQTSNDHLDQLNARAQAIREQAGELGADGLAIPGRPYGVHAGDEVQIRRTLRPPEHAPLRNGTAAHVEAVDPGLETVTLQIGDDELVTLDREQVQDADLRLAYVQHPFPAQGQTTDTTHLVITDHSTREGAYVGLTRARQRTDIYASEPAPSEPGADRLQALAESMSRTEPEMASIATPLRQEEQILQIADDEQTVSRHAPTHHEAERHDGPERAFEPAGVTVAHDDGQTQTEGRGRDTVVNIEPEPREGPDVQIPGDSHERPALEAPAPAPRRWPRSLDDTPAARERDLTREDPGLGYEP